MIRNETRYPSPMLRACFVAVVRDVEGVLTRHPVRSTCPVVTDGRASLRAQPILTMCEVTWVRSRRDCTSGWARLSGRATRLRLPPRECPLDRLLWLVQHEAWHLFGINHPEFPHAVMHESPSGLAAMRERHADLFARYGDVVREAEPVAKPAPTLDDRRAAKVVSLRERIEQWERKRKRAERALAKLRKQARYYDQAIAASRPSNGGA